MTGTKVHLSRWQFGITISHHFLLHEPQVIGLNQHAMRQLPGKARLEIIPGTSHLFEEPGALEQVARLARELFGQPCGRCPLANHT